MQEELINLSEGFSVLPNTISANKQLSWKAKGLLAFILNPPPGWSFSVRGLAGMATEGESAVRSALLEMEKSGHLLRERVRDSNGRFFKMRYTVSDRPIFLKNLPSSDLPLCENHKVANINLTNKNITSGVNNNINNKYTRTRESSAAAKNAYTLKNYILLPHEEWNATTAEFIKLHDRVSVDVNLPENVDLKLLNHKISESKKVLQQFTLTSYFVNNYEKIIVDGFKDFNNTKSSGGNYVEDSTWY